MSGTMPDPDSGANPFAELAKFALAATEPFMQMMHAWTDAFARFSGIGTADPRSS